MHRFGQMGNGAMDEIWDGDGTGSGNHKPSSTEPGKTLFPPGTTKAQVEDGFKSIATNPPAKRPARPPHLRDTHEPQRFPLVQPPDHRPART